MSARVVDDLELIEIHVQQNISSRLVVTDFLERVRQALLECASIDESSQ